MIAVGGEDIQKRCGNEFVASDLAHGGQAAVLLEPLHGQVEDIDGEARRGVVHGLTVRQ